MFMRDVSKTKRGLPSRKLLKAVGDIPVVGGRNINRYEIDGVEGFINSEDLDSSNDTDQFLRQPKVMSQKMIAHVQNPKPHIKIIATVDQTGDILSLATVVNTVLTDENFTPIFISAILNSSLINWYVYKFVFCGAVRTMNFDNYYVGKIPIPIVTLEEQQPIVDLAKRIMVAKVENPLANCSVDERRIDKRVYDLYRLTDTEVQTVKSSIGQHRKS